MAEELLSVGIDLGTSTTQLVFSRLVIENMASSYAVPRMVITEKQIRYKSKIYFTPLLDQTRIDFEGVRRIVETEYEKAGIRKEEIDTGAVIITGETARKENAREVLNALSGFAGDFVVATAGPDLESVISGKGAGTSQYSKDHHVTAVNIDIGGGTSNLAVFEDGTAVDTGCFDIGGRLIKLEPDTKRITYIAPKLQIIIEKEGLDLSVGQPAHEQALNAIIRIMVETLEQSVGLGAPGKYLDLLITNKNIKNMEIPCISFSGGVARAIYEPQEFQEPFPYGDIGILLGKAIRSSRLFQEKQVIKSQETIRATVVGAGSHTTEISGSTITYSKDLFPIKNLPVLKPGIAAERPGALAQAVEKKLKWFTVEGKLTQAAVAIQGEKNPSFQRIREYAAELSTGLTPLLRAGMTAVVVVEHDMAKVLGQTMCGLLGAGCSLVCLDGIKLSEGDYIDIGKPIAEGSVLPVVVKTLVFES